MSTATRTKTVYVDGDAILGGARPEELFGDMPTLLVGRVFHPHLRGTQFKPWATYRDQAEAEGPEVKMATRADLIVHEIYQGLHYGDIKLVVGPTWPDVNELKRRIIAGEVDYE